jgi:hypothetical protein
MTMALWFAVAVSALMTQRGASSARAIPAAAFRLAAMES